LPSDVQKQVLIKAASDSATFRAVLKHTLGVILIGPEYIIIPALLNAGEYPGEFLSENDGHRYDQIDAI